MSNPITRLGLTCPKGGTFYICQSSKARFLGCCASDPCADGSGVCPTKDLRYSSYQASRHDDIPKEACSSGSDGGLWYTCKFASPPFMGCCTSNPCNDGCPAANLRGAVLGAAESEYGVFTTPTTSAVATEITEISPDSIVPTLATERSSTRTGTGEVTAATSTTQPLSSSGVAAAAGGGGGGGSGSVTLSGGVIAGICVGIAVVICALVGVMMYMCGQRARDRKAARNTLEMPVSARSEQWSPYLDARNPTMGDGSGGQKASPPPLTAGYGHSPQSHQSYYSASSPPMSNVESTWTPSQRGHISADSRELMRGGSPGYVAGVGMNVGQEGQGLGMIAELPGSREYR